jgi:hypothetical protein
MSRKLYEKVMDDLTSRKGWEDKQRVWYEMRHNGLRRRNKPFPSAADLHYPLADSQIDKLKPFYFAQIWGSDLLASFISKAQQSAENTQAAAAWFHYQVVQNTNFFDESLSGIDNMLTAGNQMLWFWWDEYAQELVFDAVDPVFCIVPPNTTDLQKADRVTRVLQLSPDAYALREDYDQTADFVKRITGKGPDEPTKVDSKYEREGITRGESAEQIVLFEIWVREKDGWRVHTKSPLTPDADVKAPYVCTYRMNGKPFLPAIDTPMEIKDKGYYASRGVVERVAAFEAYICRTWNEKADAMTFLNRPIFTHEGEQINLNNVRIVPGQIVGKNLKAVQMPAPAISFDMEMASTRSAAEDVTNMPDFGMTKKGSGKDPRTATEINAVGNLMGMSTDLRARIYRKRLTLLYRMCWSILREKKAADLSYFMADQTDQMQQAPKEALHDNYLIEPDGSPDSWNKPQRMQKAVARYQMFKGSPYIDQGELHKSVLEEDDARLVRRLYVEPETTNADQQEDQAMELAILEMGYPARVKPVDDDAVHLGVVLGRYEMKLKLDQPISALEWQRANEHMEAHLQQMRQRNPKLFKETAAKVQRMRQAMEQMFPPVEQFPAGQPDEMAAAAGGVR